MSFVKVKLQILADFIERLANYINNMQSYISYFDKQNLPFASEAALSVNEHFQKVF